MIVVSSYSGIRPLIEDFKDATKVTRDYIFDLNEDDSTGTITKYLWRKANDI